MSDVVRFVEDINRQGYAITGYALRDEKTILDLAERRPGNYNLGGWGYGHPWDHLVLPYREIVRERNRCIGRK